MPRRFFRLFFNILVISILFTANSFAGETGKIAGKIVDAETGEPLIGANVIVISRWVDGVEEKLEITYGASADFEGDYFILNVPPGTYSVKASFVGFQTQIQTDVKVYVDKSTIVDFKLSALVFESEEVVVTAHKPLAVEKDLTATKQVYNTIEIESIAGVADISDILDLQADVVDDHFRGGRLGESSYLIGGGTIVNPLTNRRAFSPIVTGLQQVEVYTSGFSAEYGNAQSGVVNMIPKEGGEKWETRLEVAGIPGYYKTFHGSPYSPDNLFFYNDLKSTDNWLMENPTQPGRPLFDAGYGFGPKYLPPRNLWPPNPLTHDDSMFVARIGQIAWMQSLRDVGLEFSNVDYRADLTVGGPIAKNLKIFFAGRQNESQPKVPTPENDVARQAMTTLTWQYDKNNKLKLSLVYDYQFENSFSSSWYRWMFDRTLGVSKSVQRSLNYRIAWNHMVSNSTFWDVKLGILDVFSEDRIELLREGQFLEEYSNKTNWVDYTGPSYHRVGRPNDDRGGERAFSYNINASMTSQFNKGNLVKAGLQFSTYNINVDREMNVTSEGAYRDIQFRAYPYEGALYVQDKMEYLGFIANVGLRFDFYNFNTKYFGDLYSPLRNPNYDPSLPYLERGQYYDRSKAALTESELFTQFQPRIGLSFPLSETMVFHLNYGTFTQRPTFNQIFYNQVTLFNEIEILGNPRLKPENTKAYDIGLVNSFPFGLKLDVSAYYKDVTNLVQTAYYYDEQQSLYRTYINRDYADIKGFHVSLEKSVGDIRGYARYNYESATGKSSNDLNAPVSYFEKPAEGTPAVELPEPEDVYLDYDRTHKAVFNLRYRTPSDFLFDVMGIHPLGGVSLSLTFKYYTGRPYTYDQTGQGLKFNKRSPIEREMRARLEKRVKLSGGQLTIYAEGFNLLNQFVYQYSRTFNHDRNTAKWELDPDNILVYDQYPPFYTSQELYLQHNLPRHFRIGVIYKF